MKTYAVFANWRVMLKQTALGKKDFAKTGRTNVGLAIAHVYFFGAKRPVSLKKV